MSKMNISFLVSRLLRRWRDRRFVASLAALIGFIFWLIYLWSHRDDIDWEPQGEWPGEVYRFPRISGAGSENNSTAAQHQRQFQNALEKIRQSNTKPTVTLAIVACGNRIEEAITMLKSALIFSQRVNLHIVGVADKKQQAEFVSKVDLLRVQARSFLNIIVTYEIYSTWFPIDHHELWRNMFLPCSTQRLFFPSMFPHIDSALYIDSDALFLDDILNLWKYFWQMDSKQLAAMAPEDEPLANGWYNIKSKISYYAPKGLNAGIMLMNLTRMRQYGFEDRAFIILDQYQNTIMWADQDILNIMFYFQPEYHFELSCSFNFRAQHCKCIYNPSGDCSCHAIKETGASILHGNRKLFHWYEHETTEFLREFYRVFKELDLSQMNRGNLLQLYKTLKSKYDEHEPCQGATSQALLQKFEYYLETL